MLWRFFLVRDGVLFKTPVFNHVEDCAAIVDVLKAWMEGVVPDTMFIELPVDVPRRGRRKSVKVATSEAVETSLNN